MPRMGQVRTDYIYNGSGGWEGIGSVADRLIEADMNIGALRPWKVHRRSRRSYITINGRNYVTNAPSTLTYDAWKQLDRDVIEVARPRLMVWNDLVNAGLTYNVPDGMGTIVLQEQTMGDAGAATISMDGLRESHRDRPEFDLRNYPLPIIHGDFQFSARQLAVARRGGLPLDTTMAKLVTRRIVEQVELMCIGSTPAYSYGGGTLYGLTSKPQRITKAMTLPTAVGWTPKVFVDEVLDLIEDLQANEYYGPFGMYFSPNWNKYMDMDYSTNYGGDTLRTRMEMVEDIQFMRKLRYGLSGFQIVVFQLTDDVIRAINGMDLTTLQWDGKGGLAKHFKVMCIYVPQVRNDAEERSGIGHGTAA